MKIKIQLSLFLLICVACGTQRINKPLVSKQEHINYIIKDIENKYINNYFKDTNVITIVTSDDREYSVFRKEYLESFAQVVPDSVGFFINKYEIRGKNIYFFSNNDNPLLPSVIFNKMTSFGVEIDSCAYKYKYVDLSYSQYDKCIDSLGGGPLLDTDRYMTYTFDVNSAKGITKVKKKKLDW